MHPALISVPMRPMMMAIQACANPKVGIGQAPAHSDDAQHDGGWTQDGAEKRQPGEDAQVVADQCRRILVWNQA